MSEMRTTLGRVRGLGSAKEGVEHWWAQRLSALCLIPLSVWFVASVISLAGADHAHVAAWAGRPFDAVLLAILIVATFYHTTLGLQTVVEDYIHREGTRLAVLIALKGLAILLGAAAVFAVVKLAVGR